jgi:hypothetical protein
MTARQRIAIGFLVEEDLLDDPKERGVVRAIVAVTSLLRAHCAAGRLRDADPRMLAQAFGGMVLAFGVVAPILLGDPAADPKETARAITDLFLDGALKRRRAATIVAS